MSSLKLLLVRPLVPETRKATNTDAEAVHMDQIWPLAWYLHCQSFLYLDLHALYSKPPISQGPSQAPNTHI